MTPKRKKELENALETMNAISARFYAAATSMPVHVHPFIEFCGFMNEYIKLCSDALMRDVDFAKADTHSDQSLPMADFQAKYLAEKFDCIFGPTFRAHPDCWKVFTHSMEVTDATATRRS